MTLREYLKVVFFILVPFLAIMTQPDLGTGLVYLAIGAMALVAGGARSKYLLITLALGIAAIAAVFAIDQLIYNSTGEYKLLKQYQRNRLLVFLDQDGSNTSSSGYNLQQAKIAIGSGGLFGKGLLNATQSEHGFLPEAQTDFIFLRACRAVRLRGVDGPPRALRCAHLREHAHRTQLERPFRNLDSHVRCRHVVVPDIGEYRHGLRAYAHHGHPPAVCELRFDWHDHELHGAGAYRLGLARL